MWDSKPSLVPCGPAQCRDFLIEKWCRAAMVTSDTYYQIREQGGWSPGWVLTALGAVGFSIFTTRVRSSGDRCWTWPMKAQRILRGCKMFCQNLRKARLARCDSERIVSLRQCGLSAVFVMETHRYHADRAYTVPFIPLYTPHPMRRTADVGTRCCGAEP